MLNKAVKIKSSAKINLFLYVTGKRDNGYHDLFTLMSCVDLYDEIEFIFSEPLEPLNLKSYISSANPIEPLNLKSYISSANPKIIVKCDNPDIPDDESNLAFKAAALFNNAVRIVNKGIALKCVSILINKKIPVGAGLGGGSSNAASVLKVLNQFYGSPFSTAQLMKMGLELGADVPFFINGRTALAEGVGEELTEQPLLEETLRKNNIHILLFYPAVGACTADVYKNLDLALTKSFKFNINCHSKIFETFKKHFNKESIKEIMHNDLEISACKLYPEIFLFKRELIGSLPEKVLMTGSGSVFFALFFDYQKAKRYFNEFSEKWRFTKKKVFLVSFNL